jgi:hypothetical protein
MPLDRPRSPEDVLNQAEETLKDIIRREAVAPLRHEARHQGLTERLYCPRRSTLVAQLFKNCLTDHIR